MQYNYNVGDGNRDGETRRCDTLKPESAGRLRSFGSHGPCIKLIAETAKLSESRVSMTNALELENPNDWHWLVRYICLGFRT